MKIKKDFEDIAINASQNVYNPFVNVCGETSYNLNLDNTTVDIPPKLSRKRKMMKSVSFSNPEVRKRLDFSTDVAVENHQLNNASQEIPKLIDAVISSDTNI